MTTIDFPRYSLTIKVLQPDVEIEAAYTVRDLLDDFYNAGREVKAPLRGPTGEDYGIAGHMLKYDRKEMREYIHLFWTLHSDPIFEGKTTHAMRLFAHYLPDIKQEV